MMTIGLLGLQGAFLDHIPHLRRCGAAHRIVRTARDLSAVSRLIIPGGESTVMTKFLVEFGMLSPLRERIKSGMPVWGICAGAIVLAERIDNRNGVLKALPVTITRNAYGRQAASTKIDIQLPLFDISSYPAIFIRSPRIESVSGDVTIHATRQGDPVFVQYRNIMATTFHPELNDDDLFHRYFLSL
jgi:5'-phosphate synthase pdxT subunit